MESRNISDQEGTGTGVMEDSTETPKEEIHGSDGQGDNSNDPLYVQKRLKQQQRKHARELNEMRSEMQALRASTSAAANPSGVPSHNPYVAPLPITGGAEGIDDHIHRAVHVALSARDAEARKAHEAVQAEHISRSYQGLHKHLDDVADKYDDFDDVVRDPHAQFTTTMRDYALTLPRSGPGSAGEVLYKLGKDRETLKRIASLHPLDQGAEMSRLSHSLIMGGNTGEKNESHTTHGAPLGHIKSNPVSNSATSITEKTPPSEIRARMKAGKFR